MKHITRRWGNPSHSKSHFGDPSRESVWDALFKRAHPQFGSDPVSAIVPLRCWWSRVGTAGQFIHSKDWPREGAEVAMQVAGRPGL